MEYIKTVENVNNLLKDNKEWIIRYKDYAEIISKNHQQFKDSKKTFRINPPLRLYSSIILLINKGIKYDLRFLGQSVADINIKQGDIIITTKDKDKANVKYFGVNRPLKNEKWNSYQASKFRSDFKKCTDVKGHSKEHNVESALLSEFQRKNRSEKALYNIQPVLLANAFFQMATPLKASSIPIDYAKNNKGGGIDILSRVKHKDNSVRLCIMELKDEYTKKEPPEKVMKQAVAYATFIANLLRSESGNNWYKLFGFSGNVPGILIIDVSTVMPYPEKEVPVDFNNERIQISDNTFIELYSLYFKEKSKIKDGYNYEFTGSLKEGMMK